MDMDESYSTEASLQIEYGQEDTNDAQGQPPSLFHIHRSQQEMSEHPNCTRATPVPEDQPINIGIRNQKYDEQVYNNSNLAHAYTCLIMSSRKLAI